MTPQEKSYLVDFLSSPAWGVVKKLAGELEMKIKLEPIIRDTEWESLVASIGHDQKVEGIKQLLEEIQNVN